MKRFLDQDISGESLEDLKSEVLPRLLLLQDICNVL